MAFIAKVKDGFFEHIGTACAVALMTLLGWLFYQLAPYLLPAVESVPIRAVLAILLLSVVLNVILAFVVWRLSRPQTLKVKFGILWDRDKNPHCPVCKNPGIKYAEYTFGTGYYCNPCKEIFSLSDASGKDISPSEAINSL